jgi:PAS domain S-box-containing protein
MLEARSEGEVSLEIERGAGEDARYYRVRLVSTAFDDGSTGLTCIIEEITDRKRAERALVERERRFREITELSPFPCAIVNGAGEFVYVNSRFTGTFGYTAEEIGTIERWFELAYPDPDYRSAMAVEWDRDSVAADPPEPRIFHLRTRSGEVREVVFRRRRLADGITTWCTRTSPSCAGSRASWPSGTGSTTRSTGPSSGSGTSPSPATTSSSGPGSTAGSPSPRP